MAVEKNSPPAVKIKRNLKKEIPPAAVAVGGAIVAPYKIGKEGSGKAIGTRGKSFDLDVKSGCSFGAMEQLGSKINESFRCGIGLFEYRFDIGNICLSRFSVVMNF